MAFQGFLLIGAADQWARVLEHAVLPIGQLSVVDEPAALAGLAQQAYAAVIIDAGVVNDPYALTLQVCTQRPGTRVIIVTASPTWQRARQAFQAGALDYVRKSLDEAELHNRIVAVLNLKAGTS